MRGSDHLFAKPSDFEWRGYSRTGLHLVSNFPLQIFLAHLGRIVDVPAEQRTDRYNSGTAQLCLETINRRGMLCVRTAHREHDSFEGGNGFDLNGDGRQPAGDRSGAGPASGEINGSDEQRESDAPQTELPGQEWQETVRNSALAGEQTALSLMIHCANHGTSL
jgi:hypothetical protein